MAHITSPRSPGSSSGYGQTTPSKKSSPVSPSRMNGIYGSSPKSPGKNENHMTSAYMYTHAEEADKFWKIGGMPAIKLKQLELQWQEDTARAVEAARAAVKAECEAEFAVRRGRDYEHAAADKEAALQFQKKNFERLLLNAATELEETKTLVATLTSSAATSRRIREAAAKEV